MVFGNHPLWQPGYVDDFTDLRVEKANFLPGSFVHQTLTIYLILDSKTDTMIIRHHSYFGGVLS